MSTAANSLRELLAKPGLVVMPCCYDALSARMIENAGFPLTFMSGFAVSAARIGMPDMGLMSYGEVLDQGRNICDAVSIPVIAKSASVIWALPRSSITARTASASRRRSAHGCRCGVSNTHSAAQCHTSTA